MSDINRLRRRRWRLDFKWFDLWVGAFWDRDRRVLYVCPLPCVVIVTWRQRPTPSMGAPIEVLGPRKSLISKDVDESI